VVPSLFEVPGNQHLDERLTGHAEFQLGINPAEIFPTTLK
jgi:hypothetical protein